MDLNELIAKTRPLKLLYVEDDGLLRMSVMGIFETLFETIYVATNGEEGFELFNTHSVDLIITDILMPKMDGFEMIAAIREKNPDIPILIFTGSDAPTEAMDRLSIQGYLGKPISFRQLSMILEKIVK